MFRTITKFALLTALISAVAFASLPQPAQAQDKPSTRSVTVTGLGAAVGTPDVAFVMLGVEVINPNAAEALKEANRLIGEVTKAIVAAGVAETNIQTTGVNIYSQPVPAAGPEAATTNRIYQANISISILVNDKGTAGRSLKVGEVINAAVNAGANNIGGISTSIAEPKVLIDEARIAAIKDARARAENIAQALGLTVGEVLSIEEFPSGGVLPIEYGRGGGASMNAAQINQGTLNVAVQVKITYALVG
jgi:uncharacterized protein